MARRINIYALGILWCATVAVGFVGGTWLIDRFEFVNGELPAMSCAKGQASMAGYRTMGRLTKPQEGRFPCAFDGEPQDLKAWGVHTIEAQLLSVPLEVAMSNTTHSASYSSP